MAETGLIQDRYRLLELIGRGGMGEVWRARDESLGRGVAVKRLKPVGPERDRAATRMLRERFRREARVAAALQHRGITVVHDFGEHEGVLYLVMELLEGENLGQVLQAAHRGLLPVDEVAGIASQIAAALAYTHAQGIVHRDLKPANVIRLSDGTVKICDFGIARLGHDIGFTSRLTSTGVALGTPHYMSPEQIAGEQVDHRSDLYSFGCVLYELITGRPPFDRGDPWAVLLQHRDTPPEPPRARRPELPEAFERLVLDLLAKAPERRPMDAVAVGDRLAAIRPQPVARAGELPPWARRLTGTGLTTRRLGRAAREDDDPTVFHSRWSLRATARGPAQPAPDPPVPPAPPAPPVVPPAPAELVGVLASRHSAGLSLGRLGRWAEAYDVHKAVADARARALGPEHRDTLSSRYEKAFSLSRLGRSEEALAEFGAVADARGRVLGPENPATLGARQETGFVLGRLGRHTEAHEVYSAVLAVRTRTAGADHPDTLRCRHNLAFNLGKLGRLEESHRVASEVAEARTRVLGPRHVDTLITRYEVGFSLGRLGRWEEAMAVYRGVAEGRAATLGAEHPDTLNARYEIGICLGRLGRAAEALDAYLALVAVRTRAQGPEDPETLRARHGAGVNLGRLGRWEEALEEARVVSALRERVLGMEHADTLASRREVAVSLGWLGRWAKALGIYRQVADARERNLGPGHPDTLTSRNDEAHCLEQLGRSSEAVEIYRRVAAVQTGLTAQADG